MQNIHSELNEKAKAEYAGLNSKAGEISDDALDKVHGGASEVPTMNPEVLLARHQVKTENQTATEGTNGRNFTQIIIPNQIPQREPGSTPNSPLED